MKARYIGSQDAPIAAYVLMREACGDASYVVCQKPAYAGAAYGEGGGVT